MRVEMRMALLGAAIGFMAALTPACTRPCSETCKTGCCDTMGKCQAGNAPEACGNNAASCQACGTGQACTDQACVTPPMMMVDAGPPPCTSDEACRSNAERPICELLDGGCIPKCKSDLECARYQNGSICNLMTGKCAPAMLGTRLGQGCANDSECQEGFDSDDPCFSGGPGCICNLGDAPASTGKAGTCRRRLQPCEECTADSQCGEDGLIFGPPGGIGVGKCSAFMGDTSGKKYCRYQKVGQCPCGTVDDGSGFCAPQSNSCSQVGCNEDKNCPGGSVCTVNQPDAGSNSCGGICVPRCRWDFVNKELVAPGCRPGEVCWVDSKNLDPSSIFYGAGRCKPPCNDDNDCRAGLANPFGGTNLTCRGEKDKSGGDTQKRCRANGACMDNAECPEKANPDDPYLGYCDRATFSCEDNTCRTGDDPVTGLPFRDCRSPFACANQNNTRICKKQTCLEQGGAGVACSTGEYCCGEDKDGDGQADPCPPPSEQNDVGCYRAPEPPFCQTCMSDSECLNKPVPAWLLTRRCPNGSPSPSCSPLPMKCVQGIRTMGGTVNVCAPSTLNDFSAAMMGSGRTKADRGCPVNYEETAIRIRRGGGDGPDSCQTDQDCQVGAPMGRCGDDPRQRLPDGGPIKSCLCPAGSGKARCPNDLDAGIESECLDGVSGAPSFCIESLVCTFSQQRLTASRDGGFGCGIPAP